MSQSLNRDHFEYPPYPFKESKIPLNEKLKIENIPTYIASPPMLEDCFPHVKSSIAVYIGGVSKDDWNDMYECLYVYCCEFRIPNFFIVWNDKDYFRKQIHSPEWKNLLPIPQNFLSNLITNYKIGIQIPLIGSSVRNSLLQFSSGTFQLYISPGDKNAKFIPGFNFDNIPAFDIIRERNLTVFCHATESLNISKNDHSKYISNLLMYCTGNCIKGSIFHVGTNKDLPLEDAKYMMMINIVNGIRASTFREDQIGTCKFLLETPSGKGNEILGNIYEFISFCTSMIKLAPDIKNHFGICVNTCHVHQHGYSPYNYIKEIINYLPVELIHLNDSCNNWGCKKDLHCNPGEGKIPWIYLMKVAQLCKIVNIPMIIEN